MIRTVLFTAAVLFAGTALAAPLQPLRWQNRVLLIYAPNSADPRLKEQKRRVSVAAAGLSERDMVVIALPGDEPPQLLQGSAPKAVLDQLGEAPRETGFQLVLIGKDGGDKRHWTAPADLDDVFGVIDAMPMRRDEMRKSGQ